MPLHPDKIARLTRVKNVYNVTPKRQPVEPDDNDDFMGKLAANLSFFHQKFPQYKVKPTRTPGRPK